MKYKMVVTDMDGTLFTDDKRITDRNMEAIKKAAERGVKVVISTGRLFVLARLYGEMIGVDTPIIASNGAYIREKDKEEVIYIMPLQEEIIRKVLNLSHKYDMVCNVIKWNSIYNEKLEVNSLSYIEWNKILPESNRVKINIVNKNEWDDVLKENKDQILKMVFTCDDLERLNALRKEASELDVEIASAFYNNFEIMNKKVSKANAVSVLAGFYGISRDEIICIGDNENDLSMIKYAGLGVAMGNATDEVKKAAGFITLTNEEDGVAQAIEKFILNAVE